MILIVLNSYSCFPCLSRKLCRNPSTTFSHIPVTHRYRLIDKEAHKPKTSFDRITSSVVRANKKLTFYYFIGKSHTTALAGEYCTSVMYSSPSIMRLMLPSSALELDLVCHLRRQPVAHCPPPAANPAHHCQPVISMTVSADNIRWSLQQQRRRRRVSAAVVSAITLQDGNSCVASTIISNITNIEQSTTNKRKSGTEMPNIKFLLSELSVIYLIVKLGGKSFSRKNDTYWNENQH